VSKASKKDVSDSDLSSSFLKRKFAQQQQQQHNASKQIRNTAYLRGVYFQSVQLCLQLGHLDLLTLARGHLFIIIIVFSPAHDDDDACFQGSLLLKNS
jgi:hypothetical protein